MKHPILFLSLLSSSTQYRIKTQDFIDGYVCQDFVDMLENPSIRQNEGFKDPKILVEEVSVEDWDSLKKECRRAYKEVNDYKCIAAGFDSEKNKGGCVVYNQPQ